MTKRLVKTLFWCSLLVFSHWQTLHAQERDWDRELDTLLKEDVENLQTDEARQHAEEFCRNYVTRFENDQSADRQKRVNNALLFRGQITARTASDKAITIFRQGLGRNPEDPDLNREMGLAYFAITKYQEARKYLDKAVKNNPSDRKAWQALVEVNEKSGDAQQRIEAYEGYLKVDSLHANYWTKLGKEYLSIGNKADAENSFVSAIRNDPRQTSARLELAKLKEAKKEWSIALAEYNAVLAYEPNNALAQDGLARVNPLAQKVQMITQLLAEANSAIKTQTPTPIRLERARGNFERVLKIDPQNEEAKEGFTEARKKLHDHWFSTGIKEEQRDSLNKALDCFTVSLVYADLKDDRDRAFEKQKNVAEKIGKRTGARNAVDAARHALNSGQFAQALKNLLAAEALDPSLSEEIGAEKETAEIGENFKRGIEELAAGQYSLAEDYFKKVLQKNPNHLDAKERLHEAARQDSIQFLTNLFQQAKERRDWHSARVYLCELISLSPKDSKYQEELRVVEKAISRQEVWYPISIFVLVAGGLISVFLLLSSGFRNGFLGLFNRIAKFFPRIRYGNIVAVIVASFVGFLYYILLSQKIVPGLQTLSGRTILGGIAILIFVVAMAFIRKRIGVRFQTRAKRVNFLLQESTNLLQHPLAIESLQMKSIVGLVIEKGMLRRKDDGALLAEDKIHFRPYNATAITNIEFQAIETQFFVNNLNFSQGSRMFFEKEGRKIAITLQGSNGPNSFELSEKFFMKVSGCEIICNGHSIEKASINKPITFLVELLASRPAIQYWAGNGPSSFILNSIKTSTARNNHTPYLLARRIKNLSSKEKEALIGSPIAEFSSSDHDYSMENGTYEILLRGGEKGELTANSRCLLTPNLFDKIKIGIGYESNFDLQYEGRFSSFQIEQPSDDRVEKIPPALNWLVEEKRTLILVLTFAFGLIGFIISVLDLADR